MDSTPRRTTLFVAILATGCFTTGLNVGVLSPLVALIGRDLGASDAVVGQAAALHAAVAGLSAVLVAPWVDRFPRRVILRFEGVVLLAATVISALAPNLVWLFLGRALAGVGGAIIAAVCFAAVGDLFADAAARNRAIGILSTAFYTAAVLGLPVVTQVADAGGWRWALASLLVPTALVTLGSSWLPATSPAGPARQGTTGYRSVLADPRLGWLLAVVVVFSLVRAGWDIYFGAYADTVFDTGAHALSLLFLIGGCAQIFASNLTPVLLRRRPAAFVFAGSALVVSAGLLAVSVVAGAWWLLIPFVVLFGLAWPVLYFTVTVLLLDARPEARGAVMALQTGGFEFGWAAGAAVSGAALAAFNSYADVHRLLAMLLPVSLLFLAAAARQTAGHGQEGPKTARRALANGGEQPEGIVP